MDELLAAGIEPFATLYHWDLPQTLQDRHGGWQSKNTAKAFADYAGYMAEQLGDRVRHYFTINEFASFVEGATRASTSRSAAARPCTSVPPRDCGCRMPSSSRSATTPSSATAWPSGPSARGPAGTKAGFAENIRVAIPVIDTPEHVRAAEAATRERNAGFMTVMLEGRYTDAYLAEAGGQTPRFTDEELQTISSPLDFVGINVYKPGWYVEPSAEPPGYRVIPINASHPKMKSAWHVLDPEVMYWAPRQLQSIRGAASIFITENGCAASDEVAEDGRVYDSDRVMFLRACLGQLQRATAEGVPVDGYGNRFGLVYVDFDTPERIPKLSAEWFREAGRRNAVV